MKVVVTFEDFKDREDVLKNSKALGRAQVTVTEDLSKRTRESRQELRKFMRKVTDQYFLMFDLLSKLQNATHAMIEASLG